MLAKESPVVEKEHWQLDKRVPIALIIAIATQAVVFIWFISKLDSRIENLEKAQIIQVGTQRDRDEQQDRTSRDNTMLVRSELLEANRKLDRLIERGTTK